MISQPLATSTIRLARVTHVHPEGQKMEVIFLDTGDYGRDVQVMSPYAGTDFGFTGGIPAPEEEGHDVNLKDNDPGKRHINAVIASCNGIHICLGYLFPQVTQMAFTKDGDKNRLIERHTSDFVRTIDDKGNMDLAHPSGAFISISEKGEPADLGGRDFDKVFALKHNTKIFPQVALRSIMPAGASKTISAEVRLSGAGACSMLAHEDVAVDAQTRDMTLKAGRDLVVSVVETVDIHAGSDILLEADSDFSVKAEDVRVVANDSAQILGADVLLRAEGQVISNTPVTCVTGQLIIGGGLSFGGCPASALAPALEGQASADAGASISGGSSLTLQAPGQVAFDAPTSRVNGQLIIGGNLYFGDPDDELVTGEAEINGEQKLTIRADNIIIESGAIITIRAPRLVLESPEIVVDGAIEGDLFVHGIVYDESVGPGD